MNFYKATITNGRNVRLEANNFAEAIKKIDLYLEQLEKALIEKVEKVAPKLKLNSTPGLRTKQEIISLELSREIFIK